MQFQPGDSMLSCKQKQQNQLPTCMLLKNMCKRITRVNTYTTASNTLTSDDVQTARTLQKSRMFLEPRIKAMITHGLRSSPQTPFHVHTTTKNLYIRITYLKKMKLTLAMMMMVMVDVGSNRTRIHVARQALPNKHVRQLNNCCASMLSWSTVSLSWT